jgi:FecR-like protein
MKSRSMTMLAMLGLALMGSPIFAVGQQQDQTRQAVPGTLNYVEGTVYLNGSQLDSKDVGNASLAPGEEISTGNGKAELLLTPGVFLRLDDNSAVKMISPDLAMTQVQLDKGRAAVEVDEIHDQNDLQVIDAGVITRLNKRGFYEFDANKPEIMVFEGEAHVQVGDNKWREIKGHHELALNEGPALRSEKPSDFNENAARDELYNWNSLRSQYMAEANNQMAAEYGGPYSGPGWYWDPWGFDYAYMGFGPFASPFGWGFYPFGWGGYPYWGGFYGGYHHRYGHGYVGGAVRGNPGHFESFHNSGGFEGFHGGGAFHGGGGGRR